MDKGANMTELERTHMEFNEEPRASNSPWQKVTDVLAEKVYKGKSAKFVENMASVTIGQISRDIADSWVTNKENGWREEQVERATTMSEHKVAERMAKYLKENEVTATGGLKRLLYSSVDPAEYEKITEEVKREMAQEEMRMKGLTAVKIKSPEKHGSRLGQLAGVAIAALGVFTFFNGLLGGDRGVKAAVLDYSYLNRVTVTAPLPTEAPQILATETSVYSPAPKEVAKVAKESEIKADIPWVRGAIDFRNNFRLIVTDEVASAGNIDEGFELEMNVIEQTEPVFTNLRGFNGLSLSPDAWRSTVTFLLDTGDPVMACHSFGFDVDGDGSNDPLPCNVFKDAGDELIGKTVPLEQNRLHQDFEVVDVFPLAAKYMNPADILRPEGKRLDLWSSTPDGVVGVAENMNLKDAVEKAKKGGGRILLMVLCDEGFSDAPDTHGYDKKVVILREVEGN